MSKFTVIRRTHAALITDNEAVNLIATILGSREEWRSGALDDIANVIGETGRPHPGDQPADVLAMYRRAADRMGIARDGEDD